MMSLGGGLMGDDYEARVTAFTLPDAFIFF
jgi:hypothetical protein